MEDLEGRLDPNKIKDFSRYLKIRKGERGKLSQYRKPIEIIPSFTANLIAYLVSWIFKLIGILVTKRFQKHQKIQKVLFYCVFYLKNLHFGLFSAFIASGAFYSARALLHTKNYPSDIMDFLDKFLAFLSLLLCMIDFLQLFTNVVNYTTNPLQTEQSMKKVANEKIEFAKQIDKLVISSPNSSAIKMLDSENIEKEREKERETEKQKLPLVVPLTWIEDAKIADVLGYKKSINYKKAIRKLLEN